MSRPNCILIMDGYGINPDREGNAIAIEGSPNIKKLWEKYPHTQLGASGRDVGLPDGQMGNSEVGHLNIGAGRIVYQELTRITKEIEDGAFFENEALLSAVRGAKARGRKLHFYGLLSDGGVHSHISHLYALLELAKREGVAETYVHCFMDGRDVSPTSGAGYVRALEDKVREIGAGTVASVVGRYYAMDRDNRWERVEAAYDMPTVYAKLNLTYVINNKGAIKVTQKMTADKNAKVSPMFRFGMQMPMPRSFENIEYYGRGPVENYIDRKGNADLAIYRQTVDEQFYSYIRPQENGTKSDIRWWKMLNEAGNGIEVVASAPFSASALHYTIESLDDGARKDQRHSPEVEEADLTNLCLDKVQMGLGCVNSWGTIALPEYQIPYGDYEFTFILTPVKHSIEIE